MLLVQARVLKRSYRQRGIPVRRNARHAERFVGHRPNQLAASSKGVANHWMLVAVAECLERHGAQQVAGLNPTERTILFLVIQDPVLRMADRTRPQPLEMMPVVAAKYPVGYVEDPAQRKDALSRRLPEFGLCGISRV